MVMFHSVLYVYQRVDIFGYDGSSGIFWRGLAPRSHGHEIQKFLVLFAGPQWMAGCFPEEITS